MLDVGCSLPISSGVPSPSDAESHHALPEEEIVARLGLSEMNGTSSRTPRCIIIAGPNGAGKTTFAREFLPKEAGMLHFVNMDLLAAGLSPLKPELAALKAGKLFLQELDRLAGARLDFAFESTLSGLAYTNRLKRWKAVGYQIEIVFLRLASPLLALRRVAARVKQGGHQVARIEVLRRFDRSWKNFQVIYKPLADAWKVYDNSGDSPRLLQSKDEDEKR